MIDHENIQAELSARLDGEEGTLGDDVVEAHLAACDQCREFFHQARSLKKMTDDRAGALGSCALRAEYGPGADRTDQILSQVETQWRRSAGARQAWLAACRMGLVLAGICFAWWAVATVAATQGLAVPDPAAPADPVAFDPAAGLGAGAPTASPKLNDLIGQAVAVRLATAVTLFFGAWRPRILPGFLVFLGACTMFGLGFAMRDLVLDLAGPTQVAGLVLYAGTTALTAAACWLSFGSARWGGWRVLGAGPSQFG